VSTKDCPEIDGMSGSLVIFKEVSVFFLLLENATINRLNKISPVIIRIIVFIIVKEVCQK
jgi:hypothetical protein